MQIKKNINSFFFGVPDDYKWIAFFRIFTGLFLLFHFVSILPDFELLFSTKGIIPSDILDVFIQDYVITLPKIIYFFNEFGINESTVILLFKSSYIVLSLFIIIGYTPRISAFIMLILQISLVKGSSFYVYGVDFFTSMSLFYLIIIPSDYELTINTFLKRNKLKQKLNITPFRRLFQIHLSIIYFFSGLDKIIGFNWRNGESVWKAINLPFANQDFNFDFSFLAHYPITLILIGWLTIIIELLYPLFVWLPKTRKFWLSLTISMHIGIAIVLNLYFFSVIMIIWNLTLFYTFSTKEYNENLVIFYDNWCPNCKRFIKLIQIGDWFNQIEYRQLRNADDIAKYPDIDLELAKEQMSSYSNEWNYGYASLYAIFLRIPLLWILVPFFYILKLSGGGQYLYMQLALKRNIIPLHCTENSCGI